MQSQVHGNTGGIPPVFHGGFSNHGRMCVGHYQPLQPLLQLRFDLLSGTNMEAVHNIPLLWDVLH